LWFSEFNASKIGRITTEGAITEFDLPRPNSGPGDITAGADGNLWFVELSGRMDGRAVDGNRVVRITTAGKVTEFPIPSATGSPINIAVGPDKNTWYTKGNRLGRVTPDGVTTEFDTPGGGATGLTAGSDRQPPDHLTSKLWFTESGANKIAYLSFK
jgi:virginiamycin B lyase